MKKRIITVLTTLSIGALTLVGCGHEHVWTEADCVTPKTCSECGEIEGEALGHTFVEADCVTAKTCSVCGETEGAPLGHDWTLATFDAPKTCSVCGETEGEPLAITLEHYFEVNPDVLAGLNQVASDSLSEGSGMCEYIISAKDNEFISSVRYEEGVVTDENFDAVREALEQGLLATYDTLYENKNAISTEYGIESEITLRFIYLTYEGQEICNVEI